MWLPLALADVYAALVALLRPWLRNPESFDVPLRSDVLASWCLPMLSRSVAADESERRARAMLEGVRALKRRMEGT